MKKVNYKFFLVLGAVGTIVFACKKSFLDVPPYASLDPTVLANKIGVEGLLVGAYSYLDGEGVAGTSNGPWATAASNWVYGGCAGGEAHKGSDPGDQNLITPIEAWSVNASNTYLEDLWAARYDGVQRCNETIRLMRLATDVGDDSTQILAEARFLRGHYMFELKKEFGNVPWIDESISYTSNNFLVPNTTDVLPNIEADFQFAYDNLPADYTSGEFAGQFGRANKWAAGCYLAKTMIYEKKWSDAATLLASIVGPDPTAPGIGTTAAGIHYALLPRFADNFNPGAQHDKSTNYESVFSAQMSVNDGSGAGNANSGDVLNFPYGSGPGTCCGFNQPSFSLVNSYKTDANGLPFLDDSYNSANLKNDMGIASNAPYTPDNVTPVDPRLDWTAGRRGIPYLDWGPMPGQDWIRNQASAGPYVPIKNVYYKSQQGVLTDNSSWTSGYTANNVNIIRYADVLLLYAEALVENGNSNPELARACVNAVRNRNTDPTTWVQGSVANYSIKLYSAGAFDDATYARKAIHMERKLELAMEGHRFFDLSRWGEADHELNVVVYPREVASGYGLDVGAHWTANKNEYLPIPQQEIDRSTSGGSSVLQQNQGY